jgi:hypothetical protein
VGDALQLRVEFGQISKAIMAVLSATKGIKRIPEESKRPAAGDGIAASPDEILRKRNPAAHGLQGQIDGT